MNLLKRFAMTICLSLLLAGTAAAAQPINTLGPGSLLGVGDPTGIAIRGYDTVAYFTDSKPTPGSDRYTTQWNGAKWKFVSQDHLDKFEAAPEKYAPQYGGYCAYGVSRNYLVKIEPDQWTIIDGKLYLNYNAEVQKLWQADKAGFIQKADSNFGGLLKK